MKTNDKTKSSVAFEPLLVSVEGNIGAGKSTLLSALRLKNPDWYFIDEPVNVWESFKNDNDESLLEVFYKDRRRWSYSFQNAAILTRFQAIESTFQRVLVEKEDSKKRTVILSERCLDTDFHVFTKMLAAEGSIDKLEMSLYLKWYEFLRRETSANLGAIIYLNTDPLTCLERIHKRGRSGESKEKLSLDYLMKLNKFQRDWVCEQSEVPWLSTTTDGLTAATSFINTLIAANYIET